MKKRTPPRPRREPNGHIRHVVRLDGRQCTHLTRHSSAVLVGRRITWSHASASSLISVTVFDHEVSHSLVRVRRVVAAAMTAVWSSALLSTHSALGHSSTWPSVPASRRMPYGAICEPTHSLPSRTCPMKACRRRQEWRSARRHGGRQWRRPRRPRRAWPPTGAPAVVAGSSVPSRRYCSPKRQRRYHRYRRFRLPRTQRAAAAAGRAT